MNQRFTLSFAPLLAFAAAIASDQTFSPSPAHGEKPAPHAANSGDEITVVIGGMPILGTRVLPANEKSFRIKLSDTRQVVELFWKDLEANERRRVKHYYDMEESDGRPVWGEKVRGVRLHLASGKQFVALSMPERNTLDHRALKTAGAPIMLIPDNQIQAEEAIEGYESDFYSPQEVYQRWLTQAPPSPKEASAYLALAKRCSSIGLYREALDNLKCAEVIDPRTQETQREFRMMVISEDAKRATLELFQKLQHAKVTENWLEAEELLAKLDRNFPNSEYKSRWDAMRPGIEANARAELKRNIIPLSYQLLPNLLRKEVLRTFKLDAKGNLIVAIPGKQVTTTHGDIFRGTPMKADATGYIALKVGDMELSIAEKDVMAIRDIDLDEGETKDVRRPTYDQALEYVSNTKRRAGLKAELIAILATRMNLPEQKVLDIFDGRTSGKQAHYEEGKLTVEQSYASLQEARYGKGSWLRPGAKPRPLILDGTPPPEPHKDKEEENDLEAEHTDNPNVWWAHQDAETQISILTAIAAEKVFRVKSVIEEPCDQCNGDGTQTVSNEDTHIVYRCPKCRGLRVLFKIRYE